MELSINQMVSIPSLSSLRFPIAAATRARSKYQVLAPSAGPRMASLQNITGPTNEVSLETAGTFGNSHLGAGISVQSPPESVMLGQDTGAFEAWCLHDILNDCSALSLTRSKEIRNQ